MRPVAAALDAPGEAENDAVGLWRGLTATATLRASGTAKPYPTLLRFVDRLLDGYVSSSLDTCAVSS